MSFYDVPKDVIRLWLKQYLDPTDYPNVLLTCSLFHVLTAADRSEKYRQLLVKHARRQGFYERARKQHREFKRVSEKVIDEHLKQCPHCIAVVKMANFYRHEQRCAGKKGHWPPPSGRAVGLRKLKCKGLNCRFMALQHEMWLHQCHQEIITCIGCGEQKPRREMESEHHERMECWERPGYECDFGCGTFRIGLTRDQWADHRRECAESLVICPLCARWVQRQHLKHHYVKQQGPTYDNMGFTDMFRIVFGIGPLAGGRRVDERKKIHTCASRDNYSWYQLPDEAWGQLDEKEGWEGHEKRVMQKI